MEVWVVIYDNGEMYEDYDEWIEAIKSTREKAENYKPKNEMRGGYFNRIESYIIDE
jgi:hypothetical protein